MDKHIQTFLMAVITAVSFWVGSSVNELNKNVSHLLSATSSHEKRLDKLEQRNER